VSQRTTVHLLRHGEVHNPGGILYGRLPGYHLSDRGRQMALTVADHLVDHDVTVVLASPLERAQETAAPIAASHGLRIQTEERVIEAANHFEGKTFGSGEGSLANPANWRLLVNPLKPSWGEPYEEIAARMLEAVALARELARGHEAVVVSHQLPVWTTRRKLEGRRLWHDPRSRECTLASLTTLTYDGDELTRVAYSEPAAALLPGSSQVPGA
jgi:broad specificity phosphatase PhoE